MNRPENMYATHYTSYNTDDKLSILLWFFKRWRSAKLDKRVCVLWLWSSPIRTQKWKHPQTDRQMLRLFPLPFILATISFARVAPEGNLISDSLCLEKLSVVYILDDMEDVPSWVVHVRGCNKTETELLHISRVSSLQGTPVQSNAVRHNSSPIS